MTCDSIGTLIPLYYYGELTPEEEDGVEEHIHQCRDCAHAMEQQRVLAAALDRRDMQAPPLLLEDCRADLIAAVHGGCFWTRSQIRCRTWAGCGSPSGRSRWWRSDSSERG